MSDFTLTIGSHCYKSFDWKFDQVQKTLAESGGRNVGGM